MFSCKKKKMAAEFYDLDENTIKPFHETFKIISFCMSAGLIYPNPGNERVRFVILLLVYASVVPVSLMIMFDIINSWGQGDIQNIVRHGTIIIPFFVVLIKMYLMNHHRTTAKQIIDEINSDHCLFNTIPKLYRDVVDEHIKENKFIEKCWLTTVVNSVMIFPVMATVLNFYNYTLKSEPKKYMIHDLNVPFKPPETRFETPYFEIVYTYMVYCCGVYLLNFVGYDGFFGIAINHACLKMKLYCMILEEAFTNEDEQDVFDKMVAVIKAQCEVYTFVERIQKAFNFWLGMILLGTIIHVCNCMYQITEGSGLDLKYIIFIIGSVIHIYLPCYYASKLKDMSAETATLIYCCGWERVPARRVRHMLKFMIARAQRPSVITAFNSITFDMELFVSILHKSYSMFTLLRSKD